MNECYGATRYISSLYQTNHLFLIKSEDASLEDLLLGNVTYSYPSPSPSLTPFTPFLLLLPSLPPLPFPSLPPLPFPPPSSLLPHPCLLTYVLHLQLLCLSGTFHHLLFCLHHHARRRGGHFLHCPNPQVR